MVLLIVLTVIAVFAVAGTLHEVRRDDRGLRPPPPSHHVDPDSVPPAQRLPFP